MNYALQHAAFADRTLDRSEILSILEGLTQQPRTAWIAAGSLSARHEEFSAARMTDKEDLRREINRATENYLNDPGKPERSRKMQQQRLQAIPFETRYRFANEYTMVSHETVRTDGEHFYWSVDLASRSDSVQVPGGLTHSSVFNRKWNNRRIFTWDGQRYCRYFASANTCVIHENPVPVPIRVNGPLTAGIIPWGFGMYSAETLSAAQLDGTEISNELAVEVHVNALFANGYQLSVVLDPDKDFSVVHYSLLKPDLTLEIRNYDRFEQIAGQWMPRDIVIEEFDNSDEARLLERNTWDITQVTSVLDPQTAFAIEFPRDTQIEHNPGEVAGAQRYLFAARDSEAYLQERLQLLSEPAASVQNCATAALRQVAGKLEVGVNEADLAAMVGDPSNETTLAQLRSTAQGMGLKTLAVRTDLKSLRKINNSEVILHLPSDDHYVVLGEIDDTYVRLIDLTKSNFHYRVKVNQFHKDWPDGTALILSRDPVSLTGPYQPLTPSEQQTIIGRDSCEFGCFTCTELLQELDVIFCIPGCSGVYTDIYKRYGCAAAGTGSCHGSEMIKSVTSPCIVDPLDPGNCTVTGVWTSQFMRACN
jgi:hypothetical protein